MNFLDSVNGYVPPDTDIAVGPQFVVETVNAQIQFYDKATGSALLPNTPLNVFFGQPGESPFDPVVTYDDIAGRFIVSPPIPSRATCSWPSPRTATRSTASRPTTSTSARGASSPDYTKIGWNADEVVITVQHVLRAPATSHVQVLSFAASSIFASTPPSQLTLGTDYFSYDRYQQRLHAGPRPRCTAPSAGDPDVLRRGEHLRQRLADARGLGDQSAEQLAELHRHRGQRRPLHRSAVGPAARRLHPDQRHPDPQRRLARRPPGRRPERRPRRPTATPTPAGTSSTSPARPPSFRTAPSPRPRGPAPTSRRSRSPRATSSA